MQMEKKNRNRNKTENESFKRDSFCRDQKEIEQDRPFHMKRVYERLIFILKGRESQIQVYNVYTRVIWKQSVDEWDGCSNILGIIKGLLQKTSRRVANVSLHPDSMITLKPL